jgi:uridine kinase
LKPCIIAIAGPSGSGKSLFAQTLLQTVRERRPQIEPVLLREDAYYRDQGHLSPADRAVVNYDHPEAIEQELLLEQLEALRAGSTVQVPRYDYSVHTRAATADTVAPAPVIIVEGILLLANPALRAAFDMRFFMDTPLDICLLRRIERDQRERGRSLASIMAQYQETVRPMYQQFIAPSADYADMRITGGGRNRVALEVVEGAVLRVLDAAAGNGG